LNKTRNKKLPKQQTSNPNAQQQLNIQQNVFMENEINAICKLPEPLAERAMILLEKNVEYQRHISEEIIELERQEQKNRQSDMKSFYVLQGLGAISAFLVIMVCIGLFVYLVLNDKPYPWIPAIPAIITAVVKLGGIKKYK